MTCNQLVSLTNDDITFDWFESLKADLVRQWVETTGHKPDASNGTWACEIYQKCRENREHFLLPCSLLYEANEIGQFLGLPGFTNAPVLFLRFYLMELFEFSEQLTKLAGMAKVKIPDTPRNLSIWANKWAKHRFQFDVLDHPLITFVDQYGSAWPEIQAQFQ